LLWKVGVGGVLRMILRGPITGVNIYS